MIGLTVWCAMAIGSIGVMAEGIILTESTHYYTVRFNEGMEAMKKKQCMKTKPLNASLIPLVWRKK